MLNFCRENEKISFYAENRPVDFYTECLLTPREWYSFPILEDFWLKSKKDIVREIFVIWLFVIFEKSRFKVLLTSLRALTDQSRPVDWGVGGRGAEKNSRRGGGGGGVD